MTRVLAWFSCGAASAIAAKLAQEKYGERCLVIYCDTMVSEHADNQRFFDDIQRWLGCSIARIKSPIFGSVDDVFERTRYMSGIAGARCTTEMKKKPRFAFQQIDDIHIFGLTAEEPRRVQTLRENNPELHLEFPLVEQELTKHNCLERLRAAGIRLPAMYELGYRNNNCLGCVKATSARYWNMIRRDFPDVFEKRACQSRQLGVRLTRVEGKRVFLDELPQDYLPAEPLENISCGPECA